MSSIDLYRQRATECYSLADDLSDEGQRKTLRWLAICWLDLSELAAENARDPEPGEHAEGRSAV
jgi:hypothetical protein